MLLRKWKLNKKVNREETMKPMFEKDEIAIWRGRLTKIWFACPKRDDKDEQVYMAETLPLKKYIEGIGVVNSSTTQGYPMETELIKIKHQECAESELLEALEHGIWYYKIAEQGNLHGHPKHYKTEKAAQKVIDTNKINLARVEKHFKLKKHK